jgi:hypothetical protein
MKKRNIIIIVGILIFLFLLFWTFKAFKSTDNTIPDEKAIVFYINSEKIVIFKSNANLTVQSASLPDELIIKPGSYEFDGKVYDLTKEGLYRFIKPGQYNYQRIVFQNNVHTLMSGFAWMHIHGNRHNSLTEEELNKLALSDKVSATCGKISLWTKYNLDKLGIKSRRVAGLTLDEWNGYDNSHTLLEVYRKDLSKWVIYDLDNNLFFEIDSKPLSFIEFNEAVLNNKLYTLKNLAKDENLDVYGYKDKDYSYSFVGEYIQSDLPHWYKRVIQVPLIEDNGEYFFFKSESKEKIEGYSGNFKYIDKKEFFKRFYQ